MQQKSRVNKTNLMNKLYLIIFDKQQVIIMENNYKIVKCIRMKTKKKLNKLYNKRI